MSERPRYLTDEEMLHDGAGEGFGITEFPFSNEKLTVSPYQENIDVTASIAIEEEAIAILEARFRPGIQEGIQKLRQTRKNVTVVYGYEDSISLQQMDTDGMMLFSANNSRKES